MPRADDGGTSAAGEGRNTLAKPAATPQRDATRRLLREYRESHEPAVRDRLVELNSDLVHYIARRFANRGEPLEDLEQVGFLGLIQAIERFDPSYEFEFSTFATPTIMGEIRRYFRDKSWSVRVPRRLQENYRKVSAAREMLTTELGRAPTVEEIGARVELDADAVLAALEVAPAQHSLSLDRPVSHEDDSATTAGDLLGQADENLDRVEARQLLERMMTHLSPRERRILVMRYIEELPQTEVAKRLGISQMHVSRLQRAAMDHVRKDFAAEVGA